MADDVQVKFGASVEGLLAGVEEAKASIESLRAPVDEFVSGLGGLAEALGAAFVVEQIREFSKEMAELGERTLNLAAAVGTTPEQFSALAATMQIAGADAETAARTMEILARNVGKALANPASDSASAFHRLGITQEELKAHSNDLVGLLHLLAERFASYQDTITKTDAMHTVLGRGMDRLIPLLRQGGEGFSEAEQKAHDLGATLSRDTITALATSAERMNTLGAVSKALGANLSRT